MGKALDLANFMATGVVPGNLDVNGTVDLPAHNTGSAVVNIGPSGSSPSLVEDGDIWVTTAGEFNARLNGATVNLAGGGGGGGGGAAIAYYEQINTQVNLTTTPTAVFTFAFGTGINYRMTMYLTFSGGSDIIMDATSSWAYTGLATSIQSGSSVDAQLHSITSDRGVYEAINDPSPNGTYSGTVTIPNSATFGTIFYFSGYAAGFSGNNITFRTTSGTANLTSSSFMMLEDLTNSAP